MRMRACNGEGRGRSVYPMNTTYTLALFERAMREARILSYVESGEAEADLRRAWESAAAFDAAFAEYRREFPDSEGGA